MSQKKSTDDLLPMIYRELKQLAAVRLSQEMPGNSLTPTALVHEVYLRLNTEEKKWDSDVHFFGAAAQSMRRILIDRARRKLCLKRGGTYQRVSADAVDFLLDMSCRRAKMILDLDQSLVAFSDKFPKEGKVVQLKFFAGLSMDEVANTLGISRRTAQRYWDFAKGKLTQLMKDL